jgi:hypothetical protein
MACSSCADNFPASGVSFSITYFGMAVSFPSKSLFFSNEEDQDAAQHQSDHPEQIEIEPRATQ